MNGKQDSVSENIMNLVIPSWKAHLAKSLSSIF